MIKTRLLKMMKQGTRHVFMSILWQWLGLVAQIIIVGCFVSNLPAYVPPIILAKQPTMII